MSKVLLVEDDVPMREIIRRTLENAGYSVMEAANGRQALALLRHEAPDLVVTDIVMPDFDGIELIVALRETRPDLPIIAISGSTANSALYLKTAAQLGVGRVLAKPFPPALLVSAIREVLAGSRKVVSSGTEEITGSRITERFPDRDLTVHLFQGVVRFSECERAVEAFFEAGVTRRVLWDFSQAQKLDFTAEQEKELVRVIKNRGRRPENSRAAGVAPVPPIFQACRRMEAFAESEGLSVSMSIFHHSEPAMKWLFAG